MRQFAQRRLQSISLMTLSPMIRPSGETIKNKYLSSSSTDLKKNEITSSFVNVSLHPVNLALPHQAGNSSARNSPPHRFFFAERMINPSFFQTIPVLLICSPPPIPAVNIFLCARSNAAYAANILYRRLFVLTSTACRKKKRSVFEIMPVPVLQNVYASDIIGLQTTFSGRGGLIGGTKRRA